MQEQDLAKRYATYSDALAAAAFVSLSALAIALGESDFRTQVGCSPVGINMANFLFGVAASAGLLALRRWELDLRESEEMSEKLARHERRLSRIRHVAVWISVALAIALISFSSKDVVCPAVLAAAA